MFFVDGYSRPRLLPGLPGPEFVLDKRQAYFVSFDPSQPLANPADYRLLLNLLGEEAMQER